MSTAASRYLEAAKVQEIARDLLMQGYAVEESTDDYGYDLLARKNGRTIAIEVKARDALSEAIDEIERLRQQATQRGYDEFRLVVATPPRERTIEVEGLEQQLFDYLSENAPSQITSIYPYAHITSIGDVEIDATHIMRDGIRIEGNASASVAFEWGGGESNDGMLTTSSFPVDFDIVLNNDLAIEHVNTIDVDTSSYD